LKFECISSEPSSVNEKLSTVKKLIPQVEATVAPVNSNGAVIEKSKLFNKSTPSKAGIDNITICHNDVETWT